jgi:hypothetical protein
MPDVDIAILLQNTRISPEKEKVEDIKVEGQQIKENIENNTYITLIQEKLKDTKG